MGGARRWSGEAYQVRLLCCHLLRRRLRRHVLRRQLLRLQQQLRRGVVYDLQVSCKRRSNPVIRCESLFWFGLPNSAHNVNWWCVRLKRDVEGSISCQIKPKVARTDRDGPGARRGEGGRHVDATGRRRRQQPRRQHLRPRRRLKSNVLVTRCKRQPSNLRCQAPRLTH